MRALWLRVIGRSPKQKNSPLLAAILFCAVMRLGHVPTFATFWYVALLIELFWKRFLKPFLAIFWTTIFLSLPFVDRFLACKSILFLINLHPTFRLIRTRGKHSIDKIKWQYKFALYDTIRYDTIRDAILTCARKPTWIGLIYRTETTTKNCKIEKLKSTSRYVRSNSESLGNHVVRSEKKKGCSGKDLQKKVLSGMKERVGDEKLIIITNKCNC